jgi:hypothetical protein
MQRAQTSLILLFLSTLFLTGCDLFRQPDKPEVDLTEIFPVDLPTVDQTERLNVDGVGEKEWLVFYHIDLVEGNPEGSPTTAAVYRPVYNEDKRVPPQLVPALLWLPNQGYLCLYTCEADMEEAISGDPGGEELVIRDKRNDDTVGLAIFRWSKDLMIESGAGKEPVAGGFVPLGHFRGDSITLEKDKVVVIRKHHDRSDLAAQETYRPESGRYYHQEVRHVDAPPAELRSPQEAEIIFAAGPPEKPVEVKLPEKLVLAFYQNFGNLDQIQGYFEAGYWERIGRHCPEETCGCTTKYEDVSRVMVKQLAYEADLRKTTQVVVQVVCVDKNNTPDPITTVTWSVRREPDSTWRLADVAVGGDNYLCSRFGCPP